MYSSNIIVDILCFGSHFMCSCIGTVCAIIAWPRVACVVLFKHPEEQNLIALHFKKKAKR